MSMHIQTFIKIHLFVLKILRKNTFLHKSRAITLLFVNRNKVLRDGRMYGHSNGSEGIT